MDAKILLWSRYWLKYAEPRPDTVAKTLKSVNFKLYPNLDVILRILGALPVTSCECEWSISALRILKDYKRSTMVEDKLNRLALLKIHRDIIPDIEEVIKVFGRNPRRLDFL